MEDAREETTRMLKCVRISAKSQSSSLLRFLLCESIDRLSRRPSAVHSFTTETRWRGGKSDDQEKQIEETTKEAFQ